MNPMLIGPAWREQPVPPECPRCGGAPTRGHDCAGPVAPKVTPRPERPEEKARRLLDRR